MCGNRVPQSRIECPSFVGNECFRMRSMIEQMASMSLQKLVSRLVDIMLQIQSIILLRISLIFPYYAQI